MRKLPLIIITSLTIASSIISSSAIANNNQTVTKSEFTKQVQNIFPQEICNHLKNLDDYSYSFLKLSSKNKLALCEKQALPIVNKNIQKYLPLLPKKIGENNIISKYMMKIYLDSTNQYITKYIKIPKKIFLNQYINDHLPKEICALQDDANKCEKEIAANLPKCIAKIKTKIPNYLGAKEIKKYDPMVNECVLRDYI